MLAESVFKPVELSATILKMKLKSVAGFTLIELLVAMGIMSILSAIGIPTFNNSTEKAREALFKAEFVMSCRNAMAQCFLSGDDNCDNCSQTTFPYRSVSDCSTLGFSNTNGGGEVAADCGESDRGWSCVNNGSWLTAYQTCQDVGARLCTIEELQQGLGVNSGCGHNARLIWSATGCNNGGFMIGWGNSSGFSSHCVKDPTQVNFTGGTHTNEDIAVRCCGDN